MAGILNSANGGTGNGFTKFTGPTTAEKTFTLPDVSATILTSNAAVTAAQGGTGLTSYTAGDLLYASGTTTISKLAKGTDGQVLTLAAGIPSWANNNGITGTGTASYLPKYGAGGTTITNSMVFDNGTSVGINTASPGSTFKLDVNGAANIASNMVVQGMTIGVGNAAAQTSNTVVGNAALSSNTTGAYNATFGYESLKANTTGANNVAMGYRALTANTSGGTNVAIGVGALEQTTTGSSNTALGGSAGAYLNTSNNTLIGFRAGSACCILNTTNTDNIYIGFETGMNTTGSYNTFIGNSVNDNHLK